MCERTIIFNVSQLEQWGIDTITKLLNKECSVSIDESRVFMKWSPNDRGSWERLSAFNGSGTNPLYSPRQKSYHISSNQRITTESDKETLCSSIIYFYFDQIWGFRLLNFFFVFSAYSATHLVIVKLRVCSTECVIFKMKNVESSIYIYMIGPSMISGKIAVNFKLEIA